MIVALIDNGSLEPAAYRNLRVVAGKLSKRTGVAVRAVSWKHSDRIAPDALDDTPAWTIGSFLRALVALGQREFIFIPFFISPQGAIGSALLRDIEALQRELGCFEFSFAAGLAERGIIPTIVASRVRETIAAHRKIFGRPPPVVLVDHGGPSAESAAVRDQLAAHVQRELGDEIGTLAAASMEGAHGPLLADQLNAPGFAGRNVIVAPLFLSPGRHAGANGDITRICDSSPARCIRTELVGTHPLVVEALAAALPPGQVAVHAHTFA
jgi:sirohydrochlorin ferrochelatase